MKGVLLGPQQLNFTLGKVINELGLDGRIALVTAGWQEREDQDSELHEQLGKRTVNLKLYQRGEEVFAKDKEYAQLHRKRQDELRQRQDFYKFRMNRIVDAAMDLDRLVAGSRFAEEEARISIENIRRIDEEHLAHCKRTTEEFDEAAKPLERASIAKHRAELAALLISSPIIAIAGGHVAVLLNRLRMFGLAGLLKKQFLVAWSGGAMVTGERVVLFHESPPQGAGVAEMMDLGLGLHKGVLPLPNPKMRLKLDDPIRVGWFARRNLPARAVAFDHGEYVHFDKNKWHDAVGTTWLKPDGTTTSEWAS